MAKYMQTAAEANEYIVHFIKHHCESNGEISAELAEFAAKCVNYGMRCCPRAPQGTVRLNAVRESVKGLPVKVDMHKVTKDNGFSFNALSVEKVTAEE